MLGEALLLAVLVTLLVKTVYTPTIDVPVVNDASQEVTLTGCASDIDSLAPGERAVLDPNVDDPRGSCGD